MPNDFLIQLEKDVNDDTDDVAVRDGLFYKERKTDKIWWREPFVCIDGKWERVVGEFAFSFDKKKLHYLFSDYPWKLTPEEKEVFDKENPYWADFFKDRERNL